MNVKGVIKDVLPIQSIHTKKQTIIRKREILIETEERYPQSLLFEVLNDDVEHVCLVHGMRVTVELNFRAVKYNDKYFNNFRAWKIEKIE